MKYRIDFDCRNGKYLLQIVCGKELRCAWYETREKAQNVASYFCVGKRRQTKKNNFAKIIEKTLDNVFAMLYNKNIKSCKTLPII